MLLLSLLLPGLRPFAASAPVDRPLDEFFKEVWTTREGLPHNLVHKIVQTPDGYLWFATWEGVARYNGREFHVFDRGNVPELRDDGVRALALGRGGTLWLGTSRGGVTRYRDGIWTTFTTSDGLAQDEIIDLLEDRGERLWVATETAGITMREADGRMRSYGRQHGLPSLVTNGLAEDHDGTLWAATAEGLARFAGDRFVRADADVGLPPGAVLSVAASADGGLFVGTEKGAFRRVDGRFVAIANPLLRDNVIRLLADRSGAVWLGSVNGGLYRYRDGAIDQLGSRRGLLNDRVSALFQDREGSLWIGTNAGLMRLRDAAFTTFTTEHGLPDDYVRALLGTPDGTLWIGTSHGLGFLREGRFGGITRADGLPADSILSLAASRDGSLWLGSYSSGVIRWRDGVEEVLDADRGLIGNQVRALVEARDGTLWVGTTRGLTRRDARGSRHFTVADGLPRDFIISLLEDRRGAIWVGTSNGLARIRGETIEVFSLAHLDDAQDVFGLHEGADGALWLATDRGLIRMRDGELRLISRKQGLRQGKVFQMLVDARGQAWLTSNRGIERASLADLDAAADGTLERVSFESFGESDGMMSSQANGGSGPVAWRTPDDRLWFGTAKGVVMTEPARVDAIARQAPPAVIEEVRVDDRSMPPRAAMTMPAGTRKIELHFAGLSYLMPQKIRYRYRLDGFDENWVERGTLRFAQYTNLQPGDYLFRVAAANPGGEWNSSEARVGFRIEPSLLQRTDVRLMLGVLMLVLLLLLYRWRVRSLSRGQQRLRTLVDRRTADLLEQTARLTAADLDKSALLDRLQQQSEAFERQAREDGLTGLANRRSFDEALAREFARAQRSGRPLAVALADLDHFKRLNDGYSHAAGDAALRAVARLIREACRSMDITARWGGEEFALLFPDTARDEARGVCERLRAAVEAFDCEDFAPGFRLTISIGVTDHVGLSHHEKLISRADANLYHAKDLGRNRVYG